MHPPNAASFWIYSRHQLKGLQVPEFYCPKKKNITTCNKGLTRCLLFINLLEVYLFGLLYYLIHFLQYWKVHKAPITYIIKSVLHIVGLHHSSNLSIFLTNLSLLAVANRNSFGWNSTQLTAAVCCLKSWRSFPLVKSHNYRDKKTCYNQTCM